MDDRERSFRVDEVPASSTEKAAQIEVNTRITPLYFIKLDLTDSSGKVLSTNLYWQHVSQDQYDGLEKLATATLDVSATSRTDGEKTVLTVELQNNNTTVAQLTHLQLHQKNSGRRVLPVFYSDNY